ncbi:MAG: hypothetical protein F4X44_13305 [Gammaproteobacteria bacterium]|nr:hypothetical protein [Gammaproteobacteria bacterium]MYD81574.1 hypothetical protein [Gammaproteobacteria bacterium]
MAVNSGTWSQDAPRFGDLPQCRGARGAVGFPRFQPRLPLKLSRKHVLSISTMPFVSDIAPTPKSPTGDFHVPEPVQVVQQSISYRRSMKKDGPLLRFARARERSSSPSFEGASLTSLGRWSGAKALRTPRVSFMPIGLVHAAVRASTAFPHRLPEVAEHAHRCDRFTATEPGSRAFPVPLRKSRQDVQEWSRTSVNR